MSLDFTKEELTQIGILVGLAGDSVRLQNKANISYFESIDLKNKIIDAIEHLESSDNVCSSYAIVNEKKLIVDDESIDVPDDFDFEDSEIGYRIEKREDFIVELCGFMTDARDKSTDQQMMKDDLEYLISINDEYIFSSYITNEYITCSEDGEEFVEIAKAIRETILKGGE